MKYKKITEKDVLDVIIRASLDVMNFTMIVNVISIADFLQSSRNQVKKHINSLKGKGLVELYCESYPPYWGYGITEKVKETEGYKRHVAKHNKFLKDCFSLK